MEKRKSAADSYQAFSRQNPNLLDGKWTAGEGKNELEFTGNTIRFVGEKIMLASQRNIFEGTSLYDQNTFIILWDKIETFLTTFTRAEKPESFEQTVCRYTLSGNTLELKGPLFTPFNIGGTYKRAYYTVKSE